MQEEELTLRRRLQAVTQAVSSGGDGKKVNGSELDEWMRKLKVPLDLKQWNRLLNTLSDLLLKIKGQDLVECLCLLDSGDLLQHVLESLMSSDEDINIDDKLYLLSVVLQYTERFNATIVDHVSSLNVKKMDSETHFRMVDAVPVLATQLQPKLINQSKLLTAWNNKQQLGGDYERLQLACQVDTVIRLVDRVHCARKRARWVKELGTLQLDVLCRQEVQIGRHMRDNDSGDLVETPYLAKKLDEACLKLQANVFQHFVIRGTESCGKLAFAQLLKNRVSKDKNVNGSFIVVTLEETFDSKNLVGTYVCDETGNFIFKKGPLTVAAEQGLWLVLRGIERAPPDLLTFLLPLVQDNKLMVTANFELRPKLGFRLVAICQRSSGGMHDRFGLSEESLKGVEPLLSQLASIELDPLRAEGDGTMREDFGFILEKLYPRVHSFKWLSKMLLDSVTFIESRMSRMKGQLLDTAPYSVKHVLRIFKRVERQLRSVNSETQFLNSHFVESLIMHIQEVYMAHMYSQELMKRLLTSFVVEMVNPALGDNGVAQVDQSAVIDQLYQHGRDYAVSKQQYYFGRADPVQRIQADVDADMSDEDKSEESGYVYTAATLRLLEQISVSLQMDEPVLLVGETGTGKTSCVQEIAKLQGKKLHVFNMNQNTDSSDLLGGFKPVDIKFLLRPTYSLFLEVFKTLFKSDKNEKFLQLMHKSYEANQFREFIQCLGHGLQSVKGKKLKEEQMHLTEKIDQLTVMSQDLQKRARKLESGGGFIFQFIEGTLIESIKNGDWVLLDEINLANDSVLNKLATIVSGEHIMLNERADIVETKRHADFRLFMCMNPPYTSAGKKQLPGALRAKLAELYVPELTHDTDLWPIIDRNAPLSLLTETQRRRILEFYQWVRAEVLKQTRKANIGLRNLSRAMKMMRSAISLKYPVHQAIHDSLMTCFTSHLDAAMQKLIGETIVKMFDISKLPSLQETAATAAADGYVRVGDFVIRRGQTPPKDFQETDFILTKSFKRLVNRLASIVAVSDYAVILEGPTSAGKTSTVQYLANVTHNKIIRINNHMHTDIQEYLGSYVPSPETGKLVFQEGVLVEAVRNGHWVILDELNLAPSEVLEALNRLLDDNRELHIVETQKTIKAHRNFRLFATQNPTEGYGGRKELSEAFKNRFVLIKVSDVPADELQQILVEKSKLPKSRAALMIKTMENLQIYRSKGSLFAGKDSIITVRDLLKWADRVRQADDDKNGGGLSPQQIALEGFLVLGERSRSSQDKEFIRQTIAKTLRATIEPEAYYEEYYKEHGLDKLLVSMVPTRQLKRLAVLLHKCLRNREPVLLVGETGVGKTSLCQVFAALNKQELFAINCHQNTETSDFIGCMRTKKGLEDIQSQIRQIILDSQTDQTGSLKRDARDLLKKLKQDGDNHKLYKELKKLVSDSEQIFEWHDGILVESMTQGGLLLIDEISLANDSVLERLNSVFERERVLTLSEKSSAQAISIKAHEKFNIVATMNPSGDFGKKELSPALRNRMTEIWVESYFQQAELQQVLLSDSAFVTDASQVSTVDLYTIISSLARQQLTGVHSDDLERLSLALFNLITSSMPANQRSGFSIRDICTMIEFLKTYLTSEQKSLSIGLKHAAHLVLLDSIKINSLSSTRPAAVAHFNYVLNKCNQVLFEDMERPFDMTFRESDGDLSVGEFTILKDQRLSMEDTGFSFDADTTMQNLHRVLRAFSLQRPILMEGPPGVGKTSLVENLAKRTGRQLTRVNLSEQTDMMDLLGSEYPVGGKDDNDVQFKWCDGVLLRAIKEGHWFLIDEMNLAQQSVLEGLNAILDHRRTVYIPELGREFSCHPNFFVFACQNPSQQSSASVGGRKSLPKSFLNRFNKIYLEDLSESDYQMIMTRKLSSTSELNVDDLLQLARMNFVRHPVCQASDTGEDGRLNIRDLNRFLSIYRHMRQDNDHQTALATAKHLSFVSQAKEPAQVADMLGLPSEVTTQVQVVEGDTLSFSTPDLYEMKLHGTGEGSKIPLESLLALQGSHSTTLQHMSLSIQAMLPILLVSNDPQRAVRDLQTLAGFHGADVTRVLLNSRSDTAQLLGCFEQTADDQSSKSRFEWVDSLLVQGMTKGRWVLFENANLASAAVLDRLNGLLEEAQGTLTINEQGVIFSDEHPEGELRVVKAADGFRSIFLVEEASLLQAGVDVSRALRNRCQVLRLTYESEQEYETRDIVLEQLVDERKLLDVYHGQLRFYLQAFREVYDDEPEARSLEIGKKRSRSHDNINGQEAQNMQAYQIAHFIELLRRSNEPRNIELILMHTQGLLSRDLQEAIQRGVDANLLAMEQTLGMLNDKLWQSITAKFTEEEHFMSSEMRQVIRHVSQIIRQSDNDKATLHILLTQLEGRHEVSAFAEYLRSTIKNSDEVESLFQSIPVTTRFFSVDDLAKWNSVVEEREDIKEKPYQQLVCLNLQRQKRVEFTEHFDLILLDQDKEIVEKLDESVIHDHIVANSPYLVVNQRGNDDVSLCISLTDLFESLCSLNDYAKLMKRIHQKPYPSQLPPVLELSSLHDDLSRSLSLVRHDANQLHPTLKLVSAIISCQQRSSLKSLPALYYTANQLLSQLKAMDGMAQPLETVPIETALKDIDDAVSSLMPIVDTLEQLPHEMERLRLKQQLVTEVELKGITQYWAYRLRRNDDVASQTSVVEVRDRLARLQDQLCRCELLMPLDSNASALVALAANMKQLVDCLAIIKSYSQYAYAATTFKKLWPALDQLRSLLQHTCLQSSLFVHFGHIIEPLLQAAFQLLLALRQHMNTEQPRCLSAIESSIAPNFSISQSHVASLKTSDEQAAYESFLLLMLKATELDAAVRVHILDYFVQRDVARKLQEEMQHDSDEEQIMKVPFKINMQQAILDETKAMDELTAADKQRMLEEQEKEIEVVFPSYFGELQRAMVLLENADADVERSEQVDYWRPAPVQTDDVLAELLGIADKSEAVYRTETLRLRLQTVAMDLANTREVQLTKQLKVDRLALESFHESDKRHWLQDAVNCLQDQLNQAQVRAVMNVAEVELPKAYNFYHDANPPEARLFYSPMQNLQTRVRDILKEYQSPILNDLLFLTNYMLTQFSAQTTPLMKLLTGMELLLGKLDEWDAYASKKLNSCDEQTNAIKQLIIRYRKLQILSWRNLLTHKRRQMIKKDFVNCVRLIHSIERQVFDSQLYRRSAANSSKSVPLHAELQIFQVVDMFVRDSALGQFEARLEAIQLLLDGMRLKMARIRGDSSDDHDLIKVQEYDEKVKSQVLKRAFRVCNILDFVVSYYGQFKPKLAKTIARLDEQAREKIKTLIDVSKWTLQKFSQVKSNIDKTHRQLNKACKVEEEILMQNISSLVLNSSRKKFVGAGSQGGDKLVSLDGEKRDICQMALEDPVPNPVVTVHDYASLKQLEYFARVNVRAKWPDHLALEPVTASFFERLKTVRDLDKKHIQRRALIDLLKFMREQGLSISFQDKLQPHLIEAPLVKQDNAEVQVKLEKYYLKAHELLIIMESSSQTDENADIKNPDIIRMQALSQSLMYYILQINGQLVTMKDASGDLGKVLTSCPVLIDKEYTEPESLQQLSQMCANRANYSDIMKSVNERLAMLNHLDNAPPQLVGAEPEGLEAEDLERSISKSTDQLVLVGQRQQQLAGVAKLALEALLNKVQQPDDSEPSADEVSSENATKVIRIIYQELRKVLVKLEEAQQRNPEDCGSTNGQTDNAADESPMTDLSITQWLKFAKDMNEALAMCPVLCREATKLFEVKGKLSASQLSELQQACALLTQLQRQIDWMVETFTHYLMTLCKLSYLTQRVFLYLIWQGFCGRDDQEEGEDQQQEQLFEGEGCGMGDGQGDAEKNVSNEIEHEEQLEGLKNYESEEEQQQEEKQKNEGKDEEDNNDFEMKEDFDGDMDSEPQEQKSDDKEQDEPDDEMDQVDDMLDNELWDKNMDDMEQKEDENDENNDEDKRELDLGDRKLDEQNQVDDKDKEMAAGDHEKQTEEQKKSNEKDNKPDEDGEEQAPEDDSDHGKSEDQEGEEERDPDEVPLNRPELIEEEEQQPDANEEDKQSVDDVDMDQLDSVDDNQNEDDEQDGDEEKQDEERDGTDEENDDALSNGQQQRADDVSSVVSSLALSQIGGQDEEDNANEDNQQQQQEKKRKNAASENVNQASQNKNQATNPEQMDEQQEFDVNGSDVLFQMAEQIAQQQQKQDQEQRNMDDAKQVDKDEDMKQVEKPRMDVTEQRQEQQQDKNQQEAAEDQAYELDEDEAEQMQGNLAADKVEKTFEQKDDAPADEEDAEMKQQAEEPATTEPKIDKTEKVIEDANMKEAKNQQNNNAEEKKEQEDAEIDAEQQETEAQLHQRYTDYLQSKQQVDDMYEKDDENEPMQAVDYKPIKNSVFTDFDYNEARQVMREALQRWREGPEEQQAAALDMLTRFRQETGEAAGSLCEQLRIVLEPQLSQQLQGDFKSGKRLNMKKVISFIASHYRNDKIWLRRTLPSKRDYRILLAIDDSLSMSEQMCGFFSLEAMVTLVEALNRLEVGKVAVAAIRDRLELLQSFECGHSAERTAFNLSQFDFSHCAKDSHDHAMANFVRDCNKLLDVQNATSQLAGAMSCPFVIVLSDGRFNKANVQRYMQEAVEKRYLYIFVILDAPKPPKADGKQTDQGGILSLRSATKGEDGKGIKLEPYLKDFPFAYYCIVRDLRQLPEALGTILVQWFSMVSK